jgi:hypothetical protein
MKVLSAYIGFMTRNPVFTVYAIGAKLIVGTFLYYEIKDKMRGIGEVLAK